MQPSPRQTFAEHGRRGAFNGFSKASILGAWPHVGCVCWQTALLLASTAWPACSAARSPTARHGQSPPHRS